MSFDEILNRFDNQNLFPLYSAIAYYVAFFAIGEISRILVSRYVSKKGYTQVFLIELIGTIQMCTCVYENGIIIKNYGLNAFFIVVALLLTAGGIFNRGAYTNCCPPIEEFYYNNISSTRFLTILTAQLIGATFASKCAYAFWNLTSQYSSAHYESATNTLCILNYHQAAGTVIAFEIVGAIVMRVIVGYLASSANLRRLIPAAISLYLTLALYIIGVPGLNPIVATARLFGCQGIDNQTFVLLYWFCPVVGWLIGAHISRRKAAKPVKAASTATKAAKAAKKKNN